MEHLACRSEPFRLVNAVPIVECEEPLVDLRIANPELVLAGKCLPYVRRTVSDMLRAADALLPPGYSIRVHTALRTLEMQSEMYWSNFKRMQQEHPSWPTCTVRRQCNRFFAPPDAKAPPGHCTGGAVDINLMQEGVSLDHSSPLEGWKAAPTRVRGLSETAATTRRVLSYAMHHAGFSNCRDEYWHWSYGDSAWAVRVEADRAVYGLIDAPEGATRVEPEPEPQNAAAAPVPDS